MRCGARPGRSAPGTGRPVHWVVCDITTPEGRAAALAACAEPDILINNAGGPPPGDFRDWDRAAWIRALDANMLTPIELIKATVDAMIARKFGRIVNITSSAVKAPIDILGLSNGARSGLTGFVAGLARKVASHNVTINNLLPGSFDTDRLRTTMEGRAKAAGKLLAEVMHAGAAAVPAGRSASATSSVPSARFSAASMPVTSSARTSCRTAVPTRARSDITQGGYDGTATQRIQARHSRGPAADRIVVSLSSTIRWS